MRLLIVHSIFLILFGYVRCLNSPHVIIIGAGAAGISAATKLYQNGITNITILEAENRIGGRIYSVKFGESYIDLGAQWCHGEKNNIVYSLVKDLNVLISDESLPILYHSKLKRLDEEFRLQLLQIFEVLYLENHEQQLGSLGDAFIKKYNETIRETWKGDDSKITLAEDCLDLLHNFVLSYEGAFSWFDVSANSSYETAEGNQDLGWNGRGYKTILEVLMQTFPESKTPIPIENRIILNKEVTQLTWAEDPDSKNVVVNCADGTSYSGNHVISTVSLGVLKDRYKSLFQPQLPHEKVKAIQTLGIDGVGKIFLNFPNKWWDEKFPGAAFAWSTKDLEKLTDEFPEEQQFWITAIIAVITIPDNPHVLAIWITGENVPIIENLSDEIVIKGVVNLLNYFIGQDYPNITHPDTIIRNNWYSNPHFRGTYSYETVGTQKADKPLHAVLSEPLMSKEGKPVLLFAGEATNTIHHSTVHGAIETGFREADRLIKLYKETHF